MKRCVSRPWRIDYCLCLAQSLILTVSGSHPFVNSDTDLSKNGELNYLFDFETIEVDKLPLNAENTSKDEDEFLFPLFSRETTNFKLNSFSLKEEVEHTVEVRRPNSYYFANPQPNVKRQYELAAISFEEIFSLPRMQHKDSSPFKVVLLNEHKKICRRKLRLGSKQRKLRIASRQHIYKKVQNRSPAKKQRVLP